MEILTVQHFTRILQSTVCSISYRSLHSIINMKETSQQLLWKVQAKRQREAIARALIILKSEVAM